MYKINITLEVWQLLFVFVFAVVFLSVFPKHGDINGIQWYGSLIESTKAWNKAHGNRIHRRISLRSSTTVIVHDIPMPPNSST